MAKPNPAVMWSPGRVLLYLDLEFGCGCFKICAFDSTQSRSFCLKQRIGHEADGQPGLFRPPTLSDVEQFGSFYTSDVYTQQRHRLVLVCEGLNAQQPSNHRTST